MSDSNVRAAERLGLLTAETSEGAQELQRRAATNVDELGREVGAVLRLDGLTLDPTSIDHERRDDETMIINMGPSHPSTHGVLRLMLELDGEFVLRTKPVIGYLHTGMEKTGEELSYIQGATNVTRMDYLSPVINELCYSMAVEKLLGIEVPERAVWIRMMMSELNRISSHLVWMATNGMDLGASSMMIYGLRERELILAFFEKTAGLRLNLNYVRPGGVAADLPDGWPDDVLVICDTIYARTFEYDELLTGQPIFRNRMVGVAPLAAEEASPDRCFVRPGWRGTCAARCRTSPTTRSNSTSSSARTATTSIVTPFDSTRSASRFASCASASRRCRAATTAVRIPKSRRRRGRASASRWRH
jgi:NADH-quinone oxidoreductase subunit D